MNDTPTVSVVIPMRNEAGQIAECLESALANVLAEGTIEFLVIDGASTDESRGIVETFARRDSRVRLLANPDRLQAAAFNIGIREARGRYVVRMDAHSRYSADYVAESVRLLERTGAGNVGGVQRATGTTAVGRAIAAAVASPFAAGDAKYRNATEPGWVDTVYLGAWKTELLRELGGMRTDLAVNEDYELNVRLHRLGHGVYLSPSIKSTYFVRASLPKLARQYGRYGFWKVRTLTDHPGSLRWRQLVAPAFVLSIVATPMAVATLGPVGWLHLAVYSIANVTASMFVASRTSWRHLPLLPWIFTLVHLSWGASFLAGLVWWPLQAIRRDR